LQADALVSLGQSWNPALRREIARGLAAKGESMIPMLLEATRSQSWQQREVAAQTLTEMIKQDKHHWREAFPDITDRREVVDRVRQKYAAADPILVRLASDPRTEVRSAALDGFAWLQPQSSESAEAVLHLCNDPDLYVANQAMMVFGRGLNLDNLDPQETIIGLGRAMKNPLPRGKGDVVRSIAEMPEKTQREFVPVLLDHLDWIAHRDTMFAAAGQAEALQLLTKLNVKEVIPRIPTLMHKSFHGSNLLGPCMEAAIAFGADAKIILPELKEEITKLEMQKSSESNPRTQKAIDDQIKQIRKAVGHVEKL
jgi:hypothetical protein